MDHLNKGTRDVIDASKDEKIRFIRGYKWIGYSRATEILNVIDTLVDLPRSTRMPNILLYGPSNNGKTVIIERFSKKYPMEFDENEELKRDVMKVECPPQADEKRLYQQILRELVIPFRTNHRADILWDQVINAFRVLDLKVLIIDEIHHISFGNKDRRQIFLNALKTLSNILSISIVAVGTKDAFHVFQSDPQISSRFDPMALPLWDVNSEYIKFLNSYERILPLREKSDLYSKEIAMKILSLSDNTIGGIAKVLKEAAIYAIKKGEERINLEIINKCGVKHPDEIRRRVLE